MLKAVTSTTLLLRKNKYQHKGIFIFLQYDSVLEHQGREDSLSVIERFDAISGE